ncbi:MAG TPA: M42 family peptidase, partial [Bacillota bacterium]|nr:M42 family peptidase [Bacillota bacterium]
MDGKAILKSLIENTGVSGFESPVASAIYQGFQMFTSEIRTDPMGSVIAKIKGEATEHNLSVMLAGHMDEIGLMVTKVDDLGFLHVAQIGGFDQRTLPAQEVIVHGKKDCPGVVAAKPPHLLSVEERKKTVPLSDLLIDIGYKAKQARELVSVGDLITIRRTMQE